MNSTTLGIACQGNFDVTEMPEPQFAALVELLQEARRRYGKIPIVGHRDVAATACPGNYFPLAEVVSVVDTLEKRPAAAALDSLNLQIDGLNLQLEGINVNGRIFAPARALLEATGRKVSWDEKTRTVIARLL
jgi:N-acetyl-anhydromuramyl-L-alanine amidase AmpD